MNDRSEETKLVAKVRRARQRLRKQYHRTVTQYGEVHRAQGAVYVAGVWVPEQRVEQVSRRLTRDTVLGLVEFHLAVLVVLALLRFVWIGFAWLLLP